ncbi:MAG: hypothetical protein HKN87_05275 [Saprospiraceae bacterium]|nr:hypothetical protein [Saprospiraceae bacterium]
MKELDRTHKNLINSEFGLNLEDQPPDEELIKVLSDRIAYLLMHEMESFMTLMYRMDVSEKKVAAALSPTNQEAPNVALAKLIIQRQLDRMQTKSKYKQTPLKDWMDF